MNVHNEVVSFGFDVLLERAQRVKSLPGVKSIGSIEILIRFDELGVFDPGHIVDLPIGESRPQNAKQWR
jgi:hypothetical protein